MKTAYEQRHSIDIITTEIFLDTSFIQSIIINYFNSMNKVFVNKFNRWNWLFYQLESTKIIRTFVMIRIDCDLNIIFTCKQSKQLQPGFIGCSVALLKPLSYFSWVSFVSVNHPTHWHAKTSKTFEGAENQDITAMITDTKEKEVFFY